MGRRPKNYDETQNVFDQIKYERLLSQTNEYIKVKPIDPEKTIHLITKIRGNRGVNDFASAIGTISRIQLYRIYKEFNQGLRNTTIAGILSAQLPDSNILLDAFMEAQGKIRKDKLDEYKITHNIELRQILEYTLFLSGCKLQMQGETIKNKSRAEDQSKFSIRIQQQNQKEFFWIFEIRAFPYTGKKEDYSSVINKLVSDLVTVSIQDYGKANRYSMIIDNELVYRELKEKASTIRLPKEISIIYISAFHRKVVEEYIIPSTQENQNVFPFMQSLIFSHESIVYSLEEKYKIDCCAITLDHILQKGYSIHSSKSRRSVSLFNFIDLHPDLSVVVTRSNSLDDIRTFFIKDITDFTDYSKISQSIHDWLLQIIACFYTGRFGNRDIASLVVNNPTFYNNISNEFISSHISDQISVILIDMDERSIRDEKNIPMIKRKKNHNETED